MPTQLILAATAPDVIMLLLAVFVGIPLMIVAMVYLVVPTCKGIIWLIKQIFTFIFGMIADALRFVGAIITTLVLVPLTVGNVMIGRWSASAHFGRAIQSEFKTAGRSVYRLVIGHPARLLCLTALTEGIERRIPEVMAAAPGADRPSRRLGSFDGYTIVGSLQGGGSGGRLYVARPNEQKLAAFSRGGVSDVDQVVIKTFSLSDGSSLPQIVRENRALDAAKRLGLILEHDLTDERFFYVMRYVPGDSLNLVTQRLHAASGGGGLGRPELAQCLEFTCDLLRTLCHYHQGGLWHKDVKPDNIIVSEGQAHLVDFGLITPLRSSMTLTTHGTEYFRDPEMVRLALKGVKVQDVDGGKFDIYAVGAVMYSMIENSFPAHGGLSQIGRNCPEPIRMIVRRAMADYDKRYLNTWDMLQDVETVLRSDDPYAMKVIALPSMRGAAREDGAAPAHGSPNPAWHQPMQGQAWGRAAEGVRTPASPGAWPGSPVQEPVVVGAGAGGARAVDSNGRMRPKLRVTDWWRGSYVVESEAPAAPAAPAPFGSASEGFVMQATVGVPGRGVWAATPAGFNRVEPAAAPAPNATPFRRGRAAGSTAPAKEQLSRARARALAAQQRVRARIQARNRNYPSGLNVGIGAAALLFAMAVCGALVLVFANRPSQLLRLPSATMVMDGPAQTSPVPNAYEVERSLNIGVDGITYTATHSAPSPVSGSGEEILLLCDWSKFSKEQQTDLRRRMANMQHAGFTISGDAPADMHPDNVDDDLAEVAELRSELGTRIFRTEDARATVRRWLDETGSADVVAWITSDPERNDGVSIVTWLISRSAMDQGVFDAAQRTFDSE